MKFEGNFEVIGYSQLTIGFCSTVMDDETLITELTKVKGIGNHHLFI